MTNWVILGANGMLGQEFMHLLHSERIKGFSRDECDVTNFSQLIKVINSNDVVINCAAWTAVDDAEVHEDAAFELNAIGAKNIAEACLANNARMVQISTDYVFSGLTKTPVLVDEIPDPKSAYGRTKLAGEIYVREILPRGHFVVRTAWLYGKYGNNFVKTILELEKRQGQIAVVNDQFGQPTWTLDLAKLIVQIVDRAPSGTYHGTSSGKASWHEFAQEIFQCIGSDINRIQTTSSDKFQRPAIRPRYSVLDHSELEQIGVKPIRDWKDALHDAFAQATFASL